MIISALVAVTERRSSAILVRSLKSLGHQVHLEREPQEVVRAAVEFSPRFIFIDMDSRRGDPFELAERLRRLTRCYLYGLVGPGRSSRLELALRSGVNEFMRKPLSRPEIRSRLESMNVLLSSGSLAERATPGIGRRTDGNFDRLTASTALPGESMATARVAIPEVSHGRRILVVGGDPECRGQHRRILEPAGYEVMEAGGVSEALCRVDAVRPDLVMIDDSKMNGERLGLTQRLKSDPRYEHVPILLVSARADSEDFVRGIAAGADEYLMSPVVGGELTTRVESLLRARRALASLRIQKRELSAQVRMARSLVDISRSIAQTTREDLVIGDVIRTARELTRASRLAVLLPDADGQRLRVAGASGIPRGEHARIEPQRGVGIVDRVFRTGVGVFVGDSAQAGEPASEADLALLPAVPYACIPLRSTRAVVGVLTVSGRANGEAFGAGDLEFVEILAGLAATALDGFHSRAIADDALDSIAASMARLTESRDRSAEQHLDRVTTISVCLAEELRRTGRCLDEIDDQFIFDLRRTAPLHDIGKVAIPDAILLKPGRLTPEEYETMKTHTRIGRDTIRSVRKDHRTITFLRMAEEVVYSHHERFDGSGYPRGLIGAAIPLAARIVAVADVYEAMTAERIYKAAQSHEAAVCEIVRGGGTLFDPTVVEAFKRCAGQFATAEMTDSRKPQSPVFGPDRLLTQAAS